MEFNVWIIMLFMGSGYRMEVPGAVYTDKGVCDVGAAHVAKQYDILAKISPGHPDSLAAAYCEPRVIKDTRHGT